MDHKHKESSASLLRSRGLRATKPRLDLIDCLQDFGSAMPYSKIQETLSPIDRVTLYRTLDTLTNQGIIHQALRDQDGVYYALCGHSCDSHQHEHEHVHFKCSECDEVTCQDLDQDFVLSLAGYQVDQVQVSVRGVCPKCQ